MTGNEPAEVTSAPAHPSRSRGTFETASRLLSEVGSPARWAEGPLVGRFFKPSAANGRFFQTALRVGSLPAPVALRRCRRFVGLTFVRPHLRPWGVRIDRLQVPVQVFLSTT